MGSSTSKQSIQQCSTDDVASKVASLGENFKVYANVVHEKGIDGSYLTYLSTDDFSTMLDALGVTLRLHRRKLEREFRKAIGEDLDTTNSSSTCDLSTSNNSEESEISLPLDEPINSSQHDSRRPRHSKTKSNTSDKSVDQVMEALESQKVYKSRQEHSIEDTTALLDAALKKQAMENVTLQQNMLNLGTNKDFDKTTSLPKGTVTIVLTDIEGSTNLWEENEAAMRRALRIHDEIQRRLRAKHFGYEIDTAGDAFFLAFSEAPDALAFALELQTALNDAPWDKEILKLPWASDDGNRRGLRARVAIHTGSAKHVQNPVTGRTEYVGEAMDVAQKVEKMARGGQILSTNVTWNAAFHIAEVTLGSPIVHEAGELVEGIPVMDIAPKMLPPLSGATNRRASIRAKGKSVTTREHCNAEECPTKKVVEFTVINNETAAARQLRLSKEVPPQGTFSKNRPTSLGVATPEKSPIRV